MKKIFASLLSVILLWLSLSDGCFVYAQTQTDNNSLETFALSLADMIRNHDKGYTNIADEFIDIDNDNVNADDITQRLPISYIKNSNDTATFFADGISVTVKNDSNVLTVNDLGTEYTVTAESEAEVTDGEVNVPVYELMDSLGYSVQTVDKKAFINNSFFTKRLIVKCSGKIDTYGATDYLSGYKDLHILQYPDIETTKAAYIKYAEDDRVVYVEPDEIRIMQETEGQKIEISGSLDDVKDKALSYVSEFIGFTDIKQQLKDRVLKDVLVAVIDSGVDTDHELLVDRLLPNNVNLSSTGEENSCEDDYGHGTHVAGIVANNTLKNVKIKPYKVLNNQGKGSSSLIAIAIDLAVADGANIINLSLSAEGESQTMADSINSAVENDVNVIAAAGNNHTDLSKKYYAPSCIESAVTVSAVTKYNKLSDYSNYNGPIDIAAPGDNIKSSSLNNTYKLMSGTSMAAPCVSAAFAVVRSVYDKSAAEVEKMIKEYAIKMPENEGENCFGEGIVYLKYILQALPRTADVVFDFEEGEFNNSFKLTLSCPEVGATILYVLNSDDETPNIGYINGKKYVEPLVISTTTKVSAVAIVKGKMFSKVISKTYSRSDKTDADYYDIDSSGMITGYFGIDTELNVPKEIQGITVRGVGTNAFRENSKIKSVNLPDTATRISMYAFYGCTALDSVTGSGITTVDSGAFQISTIRDFPFEQLTVIGAKAFSGCNRLENVNLTNVTNIETSAFESSDGIVELVGEKIRTIGKYAFRNTDMKKISLPILSVINESVFEDCSFLTEVNAEKVSTVGTKSFKNCISLNNIQLPKANIINKEAFANNAVASVELPQATKLSSNAFSGCSNLKSAFFPKVTQIESNVFLNCKNLWALSLPKLEILPSNAFSNCEKLTSVWLPSVKTVNSSAFNNSSIKFVQFDCVTAISDLPDNLEILVLPSSIMNISAQTPETDYKVYGFADTYAQSYAQEVTKEFVPVPALVFEQEPKFSVEEKYIQAYAVGFNCTYQWYKNSDLSNEGGVPIEGAVRPYYEPSRDDGAAAYYCVIVCDDGYCSQTVVTPYIENAPEYREADYTEYNMIISSLGEIDREIYTEESLKVLDNLVNQDISGLSLAEQENIENQISAIEEAKKSLKLAYTLNDVDNDGEITLIDARMALMACVGTVELNKLQFLSADIDSDGDISLADVRTILMQVINN